jgi:hypothetical protein
VPLSLAAVVEHALPARSVALADGVQTIDAAPGARWSSSGSAFRA